MRFKWVGVDTAPKDDRILEKMSKGHSLAFGIVGYGGGAGSDFVNTNGRDFDVANEGGSGGGGGPFSERDGFVGGKASGDIYSVSQLVAGIEYNELMAYAGNGGTNMRTGGAGTAGGGGGAGEDGLPGYANEPGYTSSITNGRGGDRIQIDILGTPLGGVPVVVALLERIAQQVVAQLLEMEVKAAVAAVGKPIQRT